MKFITEIWHPNGKQCQSSSFLQLRMKILARQMNTILFVLEVLKYLHLSYVMTTITKHGRVFNSAALRDCS